MRIENKAAPLAARISAIFCESCTGHFAGLLITMCNVTNITISKINARSLLT